MSVDKITERPLTLTQLHNYNLRNQGWPNSILSANDREGTGASNRDPVAWTKTQLNAYPSNADIVWAAKTTAATAEAAIGAFNPFELEKSVFGNTRAARGHFILKAFDRNRVDASGIEGVYDEDRDKDEFRPISVAFYAGRIFYLMPDGRLLYSQSIGDTDFFKAEHCYQEADPTAEDINELVPTDGGTININEIGEAYKMVPIEDSLFIFADNGVWRVAGSGGGDFRATDNTVELITNVGVRGRDTIVVAESLMFYWGRGGIYLLSPDEVTGRYFAQSVSDTTIQTLYNSFGKNTRKWARGFYDERSRKILWFYREEPNGDSLNRYRYNKVLVLDLILNAFYKYSMDADGASPFIAAPIHKEFLSSGIEAGTTVVDIDKIQAKLLTFIPQEGDTVKYTFGEFKSRGFLDWPQATSKDYISFIETGNDIVEDPVAMKFGNWIYAFFEQTEKLIDASTGELLNPSSCLYRAKWHWSDNETSGKWSQKEQLYKLNRPYLVDVGETQYTNGFEVVETRSKLRGNGKAIRLRFESETGKDFRLLGWSIPFTGATM